MYEIAILVSVGMMTSHRFTDSNSPSFSLIARSREPNFVERISAAVSLAHGQMMVVLPQLFLVSLTASSIFSASIRQYTIWRARSHSRLQMKITENSVNTNEPSLMPS